MYCIELVCAKSRNAYGRICEVDVRGEEPSYTQFVDGRRGWVIADVNIRAKPSVNAVIQTIPFRSEAFDSLCCFNVLEHVYEVRSSILEIARVLKPGGTFYLFVPFLINVHSDPYDYHRYTAAASDEA